jgi:hypothetical protein
MSNEGTLAVFVRAFGILNLVGILQGYLVVVALPGIRDDILDGNAQALTGLYFELLWLAIYVAMVVVPLGFARLLVPKKLHGQIDSTWSLKALESVVLSILGVYLILSALIPSGEWLVGALLAWTNSYSAKYAFSVRWHSVPGGLVALLVGLYLALGFKTIKHWFHAVRMTGRA